MRRVQPPSHARPGRPTLEEALSRYRPLHSDWDGFLQACQTPLGGTGWSHPGRLGLETLRSADGLSFESMAWRPNGLRMQDGLAPSASLAYRAGLIHVQEEASLLPVQMLDPKPGERILDLCAAPGNKTAEIALALKGRGTVIANDVSSGRLNVLRTTRDRLGLPNIATTQVNGMSTDWPSDHFDAVMVDAPCSCEGTLRRHPRAVTRSSPNDRVRLAATQLALLSNALRMVRPGGRVVYSTCTFAPEENEHIVTEALEMHPEMAIAECPLPGLSAAPGLSSWDGVTFHPDMHRAVRLWPGRTDTGGFFSVLLVKQGTPDPDAAVPESLSALSAPIEDRPESASGKDSVEFILQFLADSFGLAREWTDGWRFSHRGRSIDVVPDDHAPALPFPVDDRGFSLVRINGRVPKLSTQGALWLGNRVTRQIIDLSQSDAWRYIKGHPVVVPQGFETEFGYVQVRCLGVPIGVGLFRPEIAELESLYPRQWAGLHRPAD